MHVLSVVGRDVVKDEERDKGRGSLECVCRAELVGLDDAAAMGVWGRCVAEYGAFAWGRSDLAWQPPGGHVPAQRCACPV